MTAVVRSKVFRYSTSEPEFALLGEPRRPSAVGVARGHLETDLVGELDERLRAQAAVEVVVQRDLRQRLDVVPSPSRRYSVGIVFTSQR